MNAEIIQALETIFPPEPSIEQILDRVHTVINQVNNSSWPYRSTLMEALSNLSEQLSSGVELDQHLQRLPSKGMEEWPQVGERMRRWKRAQKYGVELDDLRRELTRGLFKNLSGSTASEAIQAFKSGKPDRALSMLRLSDTKFAEPEASYRAIDEWLRAFYADNWGDPDEPWDYEERG